MTSRSEPGPWLPWNGGAALPLGIGPETLVQVRFQKDIRALAGWDPPLPASGYDWRLVNRESAVVAYRVFEQSPVPKQDCFHDWIFVEGDAGFYQRCALCGKEVPSVKWRPIETAPKDWRPIIAACITSLSALAPSERGAMHVWWVGKAYWSVLEQKW